jgi:uncharacterized protein
VQPMRPRSSDVPGKESDPRSLSAMKSLIEYIARSLVDDPVAVKVVAQQRGREAKIELTVSDEDMGRVIGRSGRVANAMRQLLRVPAAKQGVRATLDIL